MSRQVSLPKDGGKKAYVEARNMTTKAKAMATDMPNLPSFSMTLKYAKHMPNAISVKDREDRAPFDCNSIIRVRTYKIKGRNKTGVRILLNLLSWLLASMGLMNRYIAIDVVSNIDENAKRIFNVDPIRLLNIV